MCPSLLPHTLYLARLSGALALRQVQAERPSYRAGAEGWWSEVISRTAVGAGADPQAVERHLGTIVPSLMKRFSSREGYSLFDDTLPARASSLPALRVVKGLIYRLVMMLRIKGVRTGLITNSDARMGGSAVAPCDTALCSNLMQRMSSTTFGYPNTSPPCS